MAAVCLVKRMQNILSKSEKLTMKCRMQTRKTIPLQDDHTKQIVSLERFLLTYFFLITR